MANSATLVTRFLSGGYPSHEYKVVIDTVDTDLIVHSPAAGNHAILEGILGNKDALTSLTFKLGSTSIPLPLGANQGMLEPSEKGKVLLITPQGDDLIIQSSAAYDCIVMFVREADRAS